MGERQIIDVRTDVLLAPASLSIDATAQVADDCPMSCDVTNKVTWLTLGSDERALNVGLTDQALMNLARVVNKAVHAMLRARGIPSPKTD
jgi:hypothetical protein